MTMDGRQLVTKLTYYVFFPALVVTSLGTSVTADGLASWWPVPVCTLLNVFLGMILGAAVFPFVGMEPHLRPHFISCAGVGNLGNLLIVLVPSIASKSSAFTEEDGKNGLAYVFTGLFAMCDPAHPAPPSTAPFHLSQGHQTPYVPVLSEGLQSSCVHSHGVDRLVDVTAPHLMKLLFFQYVLPHPSSSVRSR